MAETVEQVEQRIERARGRLAANFNALEGRVEDAMDWRLYYRRQPFLWLGVAFAAAFVVSGPGARARVSVGRALAAETVNPTIDKFSSAFTTMAADQAKRYIDAILPGFGEAFERASRS